MTVLVTLERFLCAASMHGIKYHNSMQYIYMYIYVYIYIWDAAYGISLVKKICHCIKTVGNCRLM